MPPVGECNAWFSLRNNWWMRLWSIVWILCLWFHASLIYINNSPARCNTKQSIYYTASSLAGPRWREVAAQKIWPVPEAVVRVLCTLDDGCGEHSKHVEWTCRISRLLCVASHWTIINIMWILLCEWVNEWGSHTWVDNKPYWSIVTVAHANNGTAIYEINVLAVPK